MPVQINGDHLTNKINVSDNFLQHSVGSITINGSGCNLSIGDPLIPGNIYCTMSAGASISIGRGCVIGALSIHALAPGATIMIGNNVGFNGSVSVTAHEASHIEIGDDCLIAPDCIIMSSDVHHIVDQQTGDRINPAADIKIGRHVWLAARAVIMKGSMIGADSVVGTGSIVSGRFEPNSLILGAPARTKRSGINWKF